MQDTHTAYFLGWLFGLCANTGAIQFVNVDRAYQLAKQAPMSILPNALGNLLRMRKGREVLRILHCLPEDAFDHVGLDTMQMREFDRGYEAFLETRKVVMVVPPSEQIPRV